jgi:hypothetical protein
VVQNTISSLRAEFFIETSEYSYLDAALNPAVTQVVSPL